MPLPPATTRSDLQAGSDAHAIAAMAVCPDLNTQPPERTPQPEAAAAKRLPPRVVAAAEAHTRNASVCSRSSNAHPPRGSFLVGSDLVPWGHFRNALIPGLRIEPHVS